MSRKRGSQDRPRRKRRPGTQPLKDAHPAATGGEVIIRKLTPEQLREYRRTGVLPLSQDIPLVGIAPVPVLPPRAGSHWLKRSPVPIDPPAQLASRASAGDPGEGL